MNHGSALPPHRVRVREAEPVDTVAIRALVRDAGLPLDGLEGAAMVLVAEIDDTAHGAIALERYGDGDRLAFLLRSAVVTPSSRGRGIGTALTAAALQRVDAVAAPVALLTETADEYFSRFGFSVVERADLPTELTASPELRGACPATARAFLRPAWSPSPDTASATTPLVP
jgi:amino-acid N-acetyltransferase